MEQRDIEIIKKYMEDDFALRKLYEEHLDLEKKLGDLSQKYHLTPVEEMEQARLKKVKLKGRDEIELILKKYREQERTA